MQLSLSISSPEDLPASPCPSPESVEVRQTTDGSGRKFIALLRPSSPVGAALRILLDYSQWDCTRRPIRWKVSATKSGWRLFRLAPLVRRKSESDCGLLPTLIAGDSTGGRTSKGSARPNEVGLSKTLERMILPTVTVNGNTNRAGSGEKSGDGLTTALRKLLLPTLTATDCGGGRTQKSASPGAAERPSIARMAHLGLLPTLSARDYRYPNAKPFSERGGAKKGEQLPNALGGPLSAEFAEWMMGFPPGWTELPFPGPLPKRKRKTASPE